MIITHQKSQRSFLYRLFIWTFVLLYPTIASIYAFSPPLLGIAAFIFIDAMEKEDYEYKHKEDLMSRKRVFVWVTLISMLLVVFAANQAIATEKTVILNVPACSS